MLPKIIRIIRTRNIQGLPLEMFRALEHFHSDCTP